MPDEIPPGLHQLELLVVQLRDDSRRPMITEAVKLGFEIDRLGRHFSAVLFVPEQALGQAHVRPAGLGGRISRGRL